MLRGPQGRTYTPSAEGASASLWWSLTGLFAMQTKNVGADEKRSCCRPQHVVLPIKGFHRNPPQWVEGMPVFVSVPRPVPLSNQPATQALRELDNSLRSGCFSSNRPCHRGTVRSPDMAANGEATAVPDDVFPAGVKNPTALGKKSNPRSACVAG